MWHFRLHEITTADVERSFVAFTFAIASTCPLFPVPEMRPLLLVWLWTFDRIRSDFAMFFFGALTLGSGPPNACAGCRNVVSSILQELKPSVTFNFVSPDGHLVPAHGFPPSLACRATSWAPIQTLSTHVFLPRCSQQLSFCTALESDYETFFETPLQKIRADFQRRDPQEKCFMQIDVMHLLPMLSNEVVLFLTSWRRTICGTLLQRRSTVIKTYTVSRRATRAISTCASIPAMMPEIRYFGWTSCMFFSRFFSVLQYFSKLVSPHQVCGRYVERKRIHPRTARTLLRF